MDTYLAIVSKRDERRYADRPIPEDVVQRILDAGRLAGSASNRQPWMFVVIESEERRKGLAEKVYAERNLLGAALVVAIAGKGFDLGRTVQNMMLAAWNEGVTSCPNGMPDAAAAARALGVADVEELGIVLSFGYPASGRSADRRSAESWSRLANRKQLDEIVRRV
jgi:nitroreductase